MLSNPLPLDTDTVDSYNIRINVRNPILHITWDEGQYTSYAIYLETSHVAFEYSKTLVRRRYSEFVCLRRMLKEQHPTIDPPNLPSRSIFSNKFCPHFINERRKGLEDFLDKVLQNHLYLSNRSFHLFVQSNLSMVDIESIVTGQGRKHARSEPHLVLCPTPGFDSYREITNREAYESSCSSNASDQLDVSSEFGSQEINSRVTLGSKITVCSPALEVPTNDDVIVPDVSDRQSPNVGSLDSDCSSTLENSSPTWGKSPITHGILHFRSSSLNSSLSESPARKKRVSFHSEVTVAHLFTD